MQDFSTMIQRLLVSKKLIYAAIPPLAAMVAGIFGVDPMHKALLVLDGLFATLLVIQGFLDVKFGSASDGSTASVVLAPPVPETAVTLNAPQASGEGKATTIASVAPSPTATPGQ